MADQNKTKICPFLMAATMVGDGNPGANITCLGESCALHMTTIGPNNVEYPDCAIVKIAKSR